MYVAPVSKPVAKTSSSRTWRSRIDPPGQSGDGDRFLEPLVAEGGAAVDRDQDALIQVCPPGGSEKSVSRTLPLCGLIGIKRRSARGLTSNGPRMTGVELGAPREAVLRALGGAR